MRYLQRRAVVGVCASQPGRPPELASGWPAQAAIAFSFSTRPFAAGLMMSPTPGRSLTRAISASSSGKAPLINAASADLPSAGNRPAKPPSRSRLASI